jgi:iron complex transport system permease protein
MGDLSGAPAWMLLAAALLLLLVTLVTFLLSRQLDILSMGESFKQGLGVDRASVAWHFFAAALLAALAVSLAGVIGFVGLMVPHIMRAIHDSRHRYLVPSSVVAGGIILMAADTAGRSMAPPYEVPVGVVTGILGGLFFISLVIRRRL